MNIQKATRNRILMNDAFTYVWDSLAPEASNRQKFSKLIYFS